MEPPPPPLSLDLVSLTPVTLLPPLPKPGGARVPPAAEPYPALPAGFQLSATANYAAPYGQASLGEVLRARVRLANTSAAGVHGVKMMMEVQSPAGRVRLGEAVHGGARPPGADPSQAEERAWDALPALAPGDAVALAGEHELAELGHHILICSVAWETAEGRRTFQRFLKFTAAAPLAIKTRVLTPGTPNTALDASRREDVYLEVLMQNVSPVSMLLEAAELDAVSGLKAHGITAPEPETGVEAEGDTINDLLPGDTVQRLFLLSPDADASHKNTGEEEGDGALPVSRFPPAYAAGTVLPLGRLRVSWLGGPHREPGEFRTSMLNRRTTLPQPTPSRPTSLLSLSNNPRLSLNRSVGKPPASGMEYDLTVSGPRAVEVGGELVLALRLGVRTAPVAEGAPPGPHELGVQILTPAGAPQNRRASRASTPLAGSRPHTPVGARHAVPSPAAAARPPSRPASVVHPPAAFPPPPTSARPSTGDGRLLALGNSLVTASVGDWRLVRERAGTSYAAEAPGSTTGPTRFEAEWEGEVRWQALEPGVADLGGIRVLAMAEGAVAREWELGCAVVHD